LTRRLAGKWHVRGPEIDGEAEYKCMNDGSLLVQHVDFVASGSRIRIIQHISHNKDTNLLNALYTMGNESTYIWSLNGQKLRVSLASEKSDPYFEATFN
jgi:hypothetical protein